MYTTYNVMKAGGKWLGAIRNFMQWKFHNGSTVTWGSNEELVPHVTVAQLEYFACEAATNGANEVLINHLVYIKNKIGELKKEIISIEKLSQFMGDAAPEKMTVRILEELCHKFETSKDLSM